MSSATLSPHAISVLLVDDDAAFAEVAQQIIERAGHACATSASAAEALLVLGAGRVDVVVTDLAMPDIDGLTFIRTMRDRGIELPVIVVTGAPSLESAMEAVEHGIVRYMPKPFDHDELVAAVRKAASMGRLARARKEAASLATSASGAHAVSVSTSSALDRALGSLWMAYQPIVAVGSGQILAYEALMRSREADLPSPPAVLAAAELVGKLDLVGRTTRALVGADLLSMPPGCLAFVNLHASDLLDSALYSPSSALRPFASRIVLELTERASVDSIGDVRERITQLKAQGYRIAIDDLGAGYAGLSYFAQLEPDFAKIDMSLIRGIDTSATKQRVVLSLVGLCRDLGISVIAEGVETPAERSKIVALGADALQGYHLGRPGPPFPAHHW